MEFYVHKQIHWWKCRYNLDNILKKYNIISGRLLDPLRLLFRLVSIFYMSIVCVLFSVHFPWRKCVLFYYSQTFLYKCLFYIFFNDCHFHSKYNIRVSVIIIYIIILFDKLSEDASSVWGVEFICIPFFYKFWTESCRFGFDILSNELMSMLC